MTARSAAVLATIAVAAGAMAAPPALAENLFLMTPDGAVGAPLVPGHPTATFLSPVFSPGGERIAFLADLDGHMNAWIMCLEEGPSSLERLTDFDPEADIPKVLDWCWDGERLVVVAGTRFLPTLYLVDVVLREAVPVDAVLEGRTDGVSWVPGTETIVFDSETVPNSSPNREIYSIRTDGTGLTRLTHNEVADQTPDVSPDGAYIVFSRSHGEFGYGDYRNHVMYIDGTGETQLHLDDPDLDAYDTRSPRWSPDGLRLCFQMRPGAGDWDLGLAFADGSAPSFHAPSPGNESGPDWGRDARGRDRIVFVGPLIQGGAWARLCDDSEGGDERLVAMAVDGRGDVCVTGTAPVEGRGSAFLTVRYDPEGNERWRARYDGPGDDRPAALAVSEDGSIVVAGTTRMPGLAPDWLTIRYDAAGNELWTARYDGPAGMDDEARALAVDGAGNVWVTGSSRSAASGLDYVTIRYDAAGNELWTARYDGPGRGDDEPRDLAAEDGQVTVTGVSTGLGTGPDLATVRYDEQGRERWAARYDGPWSGRDEATALAVRNGYAHVAGTSEREGGETDIVTVKYGPRGQTIWAARVNDRGQGSGGAEDIVVSASDRAYVAGGMQRRVAEALSPDESRNAIAAKTPPDRDFITISFDPDGSERWRSFFDGPAGGEDVATSLAVDSAHVSVAGRTTVTGYGGARRFAYGAVKYVKEDGSEQWRVLFQGDPSGSASPVVAADESFNVYAAGTVPAGLNGLDFLAFKGPDTLCRGEGVDRDGDGYGGKTVPPCFADCDDADADVHPHRAEDCFNRKEDNCDCAGSHDEACEDVRDYFDPACGGISENPLLVTLYGRCDPDRDGMSNQDEIDLWWYGAGITDPAALEACLSLPGGWDVDGDGVPDGLEACMGIDLPDQEDPSSVLDAGMSGWTQDPDEDGISSAVEVMVYRTNPFAGDTDGDGFQDSLEIEQGTDGTDAGDLPDRPALIYGVVKAQTHGNRAPQGINGLRVTLSDGPDCRSLPEPVSSLTSPFSGQDGAFFLEIPGVASFTDYTLCVPNPAPDATPAFLAVREVRVTPPPAITPAEILVKDYGQDRDGDGLTDEAERDLTGTDPADPDTDGDGLGDGYEALHRLSGTLLGACSGTACCCDPLTDDAGENPDGDACEDPEGRTVPCTNRLEARRGTDPNSAVQADPCATGTEPDTSPGFILSSDALLRVTLLGADAGDEIRAVTFSSPLPGVLSGTVQSAITGAGLAGAAVFFTGPGCEGACEAVTDRYGFFHLQGKGLYTIQVCKDGYYPARAAWDSTAATSSALRIPLIPSDPLSVSPGSWSHYRAASGEATAATAGRISSRAQPAAVPGGAEPRVLYLSLAGLPPAKSEGGADAYRLRIDTEHETGTAIARLLPRTVSRVAVEVRPRPGDAVGPDFPDRLEPDGLVTPEDARHAMQLALDAGGFSFPASLDVVAREVARDANGDVVYSQDDTVGLEDALVIMRAAHACMRPPLPDDLDGLRAPAAVRLHLAESASRLYLVDAAYRPAGSSALTGTLDLEIERYPLPVSGSPCRVTAFEARTETAVGLPVGETRVPMTLVLGMSEVGETGARGTIQLTAPGGSGEQSLYHIQVDSLPIRLEAILVSPGSVPVPPSLLQPAFGGGLIPGSGIDDPLRLSAVPWEFALRVPGLLSGHAGFSGTVTIVLNLEEAAAAQE